MMDFDTLTLTEHDAAFTASDVATAQPLEGFRDARGTHAFPQPAATIADEETADYVRRNQLVEAARQALAVYRQRLDDLNADGFPELPVRPVPAHVLQAFDETIQTLEAARAKLTLEEPPATGGTVTFAAGDEPA